MQSNAFRMSSRLEKGPLGDEEGGMRGIEEGATPATMMMRARRINGDGEEREPGETHISR